MAWLRGISRPPWRVSIPSNGTISCPTGSSCWRWWDQWRRQGSLMGASPALVLPMSRRSRGTTPSLGASMSVLSAVTAR